VDRFDPGPIDLGRVGRIADDEGGDTPKERRPGNSWEIQGRNPETEQEDEEQKGYASD
jgi:hypothetical protein